MRFQDSWWTMVTSNLVILAASFFIHTCRQTRCGYIVYSLFVLLRISPPRIKLVASHFAQWFIGVQGRKSQLLWTLFVCSPEAENQTKLPARGPCPAACKHYRRSTRADVNLTLEMRDVWICQSHMTYRVEKRTCKRTNTNVHGTPYPRNCSRAWVMNVMALSN